MRARAALILLGAAALLVAPGAPGVPEVPGDPTPPVVTPVISGTLGNLGWYTSNVTVNWSVTDPESIILSTTGCNAITLTANTVGTQLTCSAESDGGTTTVSKTFKVDKTAPAATAAPSRAADANGWYNHALSVSFAATDSTSGVASCSAPQSYSGPDTAGTAVSGSCRDQAGNTGSASLSLKYDATAPGASPTARPPDANGWFNHAVTVSFQGADATSGVETCTQQTYAGPDDPSVSLGGTCRDRAGNLSAASTFTLKYDETPPAAAATPSRAADVNGWHNRTLTVSFAGSDATSGLESCDPPKSYAGPDSATAVVTGSCRDRAGNESPRSFAFKYDGTAPAVTATPARGANGNGWYSAPIGVSFTGSDPTAGVASCSPTQTYAGPDSASAQVSGSCTDNAGNVGSRPLPLKYDATAPQVSATPARPAGSTGWYTAPVGVAFTATDATSGLEACDAAKTYSGPDSASATVGGSCRDKAGNSGGASFGLKYDATAPQVTAAPSRPAGTNGWYTAPLNVSFTGGDATSGLDTCDAAKTYSGPDSASTAVGGTCRDKAGNTGSGSLALKYDATAPQVTASPSRPADANGWYNAPLSVAFAGADALSGLDSCDAAKTYAGPDSAAAAVSGTCRDRAGNVRSALLPLKYDATPPAAAAIARDADANGWHNHPLTVGFAGSDPTSGIESCSQAQTYAGPDTQSASFGGACRDRAGNESAPTTLTIKYDGTAPQVLNAAAVRPPDRADWYNRPVSFAVQGDDATSGVDACPAVTYAGPDGAAASVSAACVDRAGNRGTRPFPLRYDSTGPAGTATPDRAPDANGWYNRPLTVAFAAEDRVSGLDSCGPPERYEGPDGGLVVVGGVCTDRAGNVGLASLAVSYDATAPEVTGAQADRAPDANGWYNRPLVIGFRGEDATSQIMACTQAAYGGPDAPAASVSGSCRDRAGNSSGAISFALRYDGTAPSLRDVRAKAGNGTATLGWTASADTALVEIRRGRTLVYRGGGRSFTDKGLKNGVRYRYALTAFDEAANSVTSSVAARPTGPLVAPPTDAVVSRPPRLAWVAVPKATYYNVQLFRRGRRVLSAWPRGTSFRLRRSWTYQGRRHRLTKGRYRWYVWPGLGRPAQKRFGKLLGSSSFVVR